MLAGGNRLGEYLRVALLPGRLVHGVWLAILLHRHGHLWLAAMGSGCG